MTRATTPCVHLFFTCERSLPAEARMNVGGIEDRRPASMQTAACALIRRGKKTAVIRARARAEGVHIHIDTRLSERDGDMYTLRFAGRGSCGSSSSSLVFAYYYYAVASRRHAVCTRESSEQLIGGSRSDVAAGGVELVGEKDAVFPAGRAARWGGMESARGGRHGNIDHPLPFSRARVSRWRGGSVALPPF